MNKMTFEDKGDYIVCLMAGGMIAGIEYDEESKEVVFNVYEEVSYFIYDLDEIKKQMVILIERRSKK